MRVKATFKVNHEQHEFYIRPEATLLQVLREEFGLMGTKVGCENGDCGACTVLVEDKPVKSCMVLALAYQDKPITTIEGLEAGPLQDAFSQHGGFQCGYCTSGFIMNAYAMLKEHPNADLETTQEWLSANLCRCTGYEGILEAIASLTKE